MRLRGAPAIDEELDRLAEITEADVDDAVRSLKERVPESAPGTDAVRDDAGGPPADQPQPKCQPRSRRA